MTHLWLARHGLTDWNTQGRFQGQSDIPLNPVGRAQADALAGRLASQHIDAIYTSDLQRAGETARRIAAYHPDLTVQVDARLREVVFGEWEGLTYTEIEQRSPQSLQIWMSDLFDFTPPGGESLRGLAERTRQAWSEILEAHPQQVVLIVAHGGPLQLLICHALGLPPNQYWQFHLSTAALSQVSVYPQGAILNLFNDTSHIPSFMEKQPWDN